ncbi:MAG: 23S rRNA (guanosine(2251)-2'-O)-methyltransferase RlmB [Actinomycetes bacterium]|jgi:23S rRNA (guanosine2251-2'-O)-methyltransferase|nr:23S rRNA (guanosine(2251)-2'-O)-methyltransferase RlmB [Actinomycetes bacterium]
MPYLEGKHAIEEALLAHQPIQRIWCASGMKPDATLSVIMQMAQDAGIPWEVTSHDRLNEMSERGTVRGAARGAARGFHQGVIAEVEPYQFAALSDIIAATRTATSALVVVLDHITDPGNFGAVARSAEAVGAAGLVVASRRAAALTPAAHKAAAGAFSYLPTAQVVNITRALAELKDAGYWVAGASEHASDLAWDSPLRGKIVLVMGAEDTGLSRLVSETCDFLIKLPQQGKVSSLNVAQAATALMYEYLRQNYETPHN